MPHIVVMQVEAVGGAALSGGIDERRRVGRHQGRRVRFLSRPHRRNRHQVNVIARVCNHASHLRYTISGKSSEESIYGINVFDPYAESAIDEYLSELTDHVVENLLILLP